MATSEDDMSVGYESPDEEEDDHEEEFVMSLDRDSTTIHQRQSEEDEEYHFEVLTADEIVQHMVECIREVNTVVQIPSTITRILLSHFKWDKERLMECYYDGDQEKLFSEAHVISPFRSCSGGIVANGSGGAMGGGSSAAASGGSVMASGSGFVTSSRASGAKGCMGSASSTTTSRPAKFAKSSPAARSAVLTVVHPLPPAECGICFNEIPANTLAGLECGHKFCSECWCQYLTTKIMDDGMGQTIACAAHDCDILVDDETVMKLVTNPLVKLKYQCLITNTFVECNRLLHWCPQPNCGHVIKVQYFDTKPVVCVCGHRFCFSCGENWHDPVQCKWLKKWIKKCDDDSETSNWLAAHTRECPKCHATIEKDGGCNHMICKRCKFDFCWVCLGPWEPHGSSWYNCNRYDEDEAKKARDAQEKSRAALQRYLFYCNRYMNHMQSLKFEHKLYASVKCKMDEMQQHNMSWIEVQFLKKAVDILCQCRQTLMYTYVFAFYLKKNNQSMIFEDNQKDLENATEQLSEYLERDITSDMLVDIKQKVQDKYRYCETRRKVLLDHVHEGYEKDLWDYYVDLI